MCIKVARQMLRTPQHRRKKQIAKRCAFAACIDRRAFDEKSSGLMIFLLLLHLSGRFCINITEKYHTRWSSHNAMLDEVTQTKLKLADRWNRSEERMLPTPSTSSLKCRKDQVNCAWSKKVPKKIISLSFYKIKLLWHKPKQKKGNQTRFALELPIRALNKFLLWRTHQGKGEKHIKERRRRRWLNSICSANKKGEMKSLPEKWTR